MALDRQSIQRKDFPLARRGYDPAAVDAHLAAIADELESSPGSAEHHGSLGSSAGDRVRAIIEAAETSAAQIRRDAEEEGSAIRRRAAEHAQKLSSSTTTLRERLEATRRELDAMIASLRGEGAAPGADPGETAAAVAEPAGSAPEPPPAVAEPAGSAPEPPPAVAEPAVTAPEPPPAVAEPAVTAPEPPPAVAEPAGSAPEPPPAVAEPTVTAAEPDRDVAPAAAATASMPPQPPGGDGSGQTETDEDREGARLVALNMALNQTPRDEIAKHLSEHYRLVDRDRLLDDVYASLGG